VQQMAEIVEKVQNGVICPAQDEKTLKCYSKAFWEAKAGKPEICTRPCKFEKQIEDWNERHGKD